MKCFTELTRLVYSDNNSNEIALCINMWGTVNLHN